MDIVREEMDMITTRDGHADAAMSDSCRLMRICDHVECVSAEKSDGAMKKNKSSRKLPFLNPKFTFRVPKSHKSEWVKNENFVLLFDAAHGDMRRFMSP